PVKQKLGQKISEVEIDNGVDWRKKHWNSIVQNYGKAAAFRDYADDLEQVYAREWLNLAELNLCLLEMLLRWMQIPTRVLRSGQMKAQGKASELVLVLCREAGADRYLSGIGGKGYLDEAAFRSAGVEILYRPPVLPAPYPQQYPKAGFLNDLSMIDLILNCGRQWSTYLDDGNLSRPLSRQAGG
ncbi:MAG: hypothetical protein EHM45_21895, partial [Desulfobacteraceae bacterium]